MIVIMGFDYYLIRKLIRQVVNLYGLMYLCFIRDVVLVIYDENEEFIIGKVKKLKIGKDIVIIVNGDIVYFVLEVVKKLEEQGIFVIFLDMYMIKFLDREVVVECLDIGNIVIVEDYNILNGLGSVVCEVVVEEGMG